MEAVSKPPKQNRLNRLFERRAVQIAAGLVALGLAYVFASWAIDSGSLLDYGIVLVLVVFGARELIIVLMEGR